MTNKYTMIGCLLRRGRQRGADHLTDSSLPAGFIAPEYSCQKLVNYLRYQNFNLLCPILILFFFLMPTTAMSESSKYLGLNKIKATTSPRVFFCPLVLLLVKVPFLYKTPREGAVHTMIELLIPHI